MDKKNILLIYNPVAGNKSFCNHLDYFIEIFQNRGYNINIFRTSCEEDFSSRLEKNDMNTYEALMVAGGDGSVNCVINAMIRFEIELPVGVIPAGTMNDICYNMGMDLDIKKAIDFLSLMHTESVDIGKVNGKYFLNTCGAGLFMEISQNTDRRLKNLMGRAAYYLTGIKEIQSFKKLNIRIRDQGEVIEGQYYFFIVMNGRGAGGFHNLAPAASMKDGLFDFVGIKACPLSELSVILPKVLRGTHVKDKNVIHIKSKGMTIENLEADFQIVTDMDGEEGPGMPLELELIPERIRMILPPKN